MSDARLAIIGIDGLDRGLVERYSQVMPNLHALIARGKSLRMQSVLPPDSNTAWATIYTGLNPAQHGFVHFVDPLNRIQLISSKEVGAGVVRDRTFWDIASRAGKRVSLILPHLGFPVWPVNGFMVGRSTVEDTVECFPPDAETQQRLGCLNTIKGFPGSQRDLPRYIKRVSAVIEEETKFGIERIRRDDWDLFFWYSSALDLIMHFFWHYADTTDPSYPGPNDYEQVIERFHAIYDDAIGRLVDSLPPGVSVMVLSDHGHGQRPVRLLNINEVLRRNGLLAKREGKGGQKAAIGAVERAKRFALEFVGKHNLGPLASKALKYVPAARKVFTSPLSIDWARTRAYATDLSGIKAYSYGGIMVKRDGLSDEEYEQVRAQAIAGLKDMVDPDSGAPIVKLIARREDVYSGEHMDLFPGIVFDLHYGYGAGWAADGKLMSVSHGHSLVPGSHKGDSAVLIITAAGAVPAADDAALVDIAPTVLAILGVKAPDRTLSGRVLVDLATPRRIEVDIQD